MGDGFSLRPFIGNITIDTAKAKQLRDLAVRLARAEGRLGYNVETKGFFRPITQCERGRLHIEYLSPRFPDAPLPKTARPFVFTILVRFNGAKVLSVAWAIPEQPSRSPSRATGNGI